LTRRKWPKLPYLIIGMVAGGVAGAVMDQVWGNARTLIGNVGALNVDCRRCRIRRCPRARWNSWRRWPSPSRCCP
jgi:hypothetical protein